MARPKRGSQIIDFVQRRLYALEAFEPDFDLGNGLSAKAIAQSIEVTRNSLNSYNKALSELDAMGETLDDGEAQLEEIAERLLGAILARDGKTSDIYKTVNSVKKNPKKAPRKSAKEGTPDNKTEAA